MQCRECLLEPLPVRHISSDADLPVAPVLAVVRREFGFDRQRVPVSGSEVRRQRAHIALALDELSRHLCGLLDDGFICQQRRVRPDQRVLIIAGHRLDGTVDRLHRERLVKCVDAVLNGLDDPFVLFEHLRPLVALGDIVDDSQMQVFAVPLLGIEGDFDPPLRATEEHDDVSGVPGDDYVARRQLSSRPEKTSSGFHRPIGPSRGGHRGGRSRSVLPVSGNASADGERRRERVQPLGGDCCAGVSQRRMFVIIRWTDRFSIPFHGIAHVQACFQYTPAAECVSVSPDTSQSLPLRRLAR